MAINPHFTEGAGTVGQKDLYEDLIIEALQIYGQNYKYIPREIITKDDLFGEDTLSRFQNALELEMYIENNDGFAGGELFKKFGVEIRDEATFVIAKSRWNTVVSQGFLPATTNRIEVIDRSGNVLKTRSLNPNGSSIIIARQDPSEYEDPALSGVSENDLTRPREGDLIFMPNANALFEINFIEHEKPFYQLNNLPIYKMSASLFEFSGEDMDLDAIGIDESKFATEYILTIGSIYGFVEGEEIIQEVGANTIRAEVQKLTNGANGNYMHVSNVRNDTSNFVTFSAGGNITGRTSNQTTNVIAIAEDDKTGFTNNDIIETEADSITPFDISNPFGAF
jgi:hypothetical protein